MVEQVEQEQILVQVMDVLVQHVQFLVVAAEAEEVLLVVPVEVVVAELVKLEVDQELQEQLIPGVAVVAEEVVLQVQPVDQEL